MQYMTPAQIADARRRLDMQRNALTMGPMPTNVGEGLQRLGTGIGYAIGQQRLNGQFPSAPPPPPEQRQLDAPAANPLETIIHELASGGRRSQFPAAPPAFGGATPALTPATPMSAPIHEPMGPTPMVQRQSLFGSNSVFGPRRSGGLY